MVISRLRGVLAMLAALLLASGALGAAELSAALDRNRVVAGETVMLVIQTTDPQMSLETDLGALEKDFAVLDRRSETQMSIVGGRQSAVMRLLLTLEPRRSGTLQVPALRFGSASTPELTLQVDAAPAPAAGELPPVFIDVEIDPAGGPHYVHAQFRLTVRVHYLPNLTEAAITPPEPNPAVVRLLDEVPYQADRGGMRYRVLERHYAIFPERSGPLTIPAMRLTGRLVERRSDQLWQPAVRGRRIEAASEPLELDIRSRPAGYASDAWLPARALEASQNVSGGDALKVGEPVTRTLIVDAVGLEENMIPAPAWPELTGVRIYPDQPQGITRDDGKWVLGHKEFRYAIVPEQAGELVLPELRVHWWDTVNDRAAEAVLPEVRLTVQPSALPVPRPQEPAVSAASPENAERLPAGPPATGYWPYLAALFAVLWLATLALHLRRPRSAQRPAEAPRITIPQDEREALGRLEQACKANDAAAARRALAQWLRRHAPARHRGSLRALAADVPDDSLRESLLQLDAAGFERGAAAHWDGADMWRRFAAWLAGSRRGRREPADVTDLYATRAS